MTSILKKDVIEEVGVAFKVCLNGSRELATNFKIDSVTEKEVRCIKVQDTLM